MIFESLLERFVPRNGRLAVAAAAGMVAFTLARDGWSADDAAPRAVPMETAPLPLPPSSEQPQAAEPRWYGWQILLADAAAATIGIASESPAVGLSMYALGGPVVHAVHGRAGAGAGSLGLRLALPVVGGLVGYGIASPSCGDGSGEWCGLGVALVAAAGVVGGMLTASILDVAALSYDSSPSGDAKKKATSSRGGWTLAPSAQMGRRGDVMLGVVGTF